jgi:GGDEF domain-containing protein
LRLIRADNSPVDKNWILIDPDTGLHVEWYFWLRVLDEANRSARYGNPFGLLIMEADVEGLAPRQRDEALSTVASAIRSTDIAGRLGASRVGVILLEQEAESAATGAARIQERLRAASDVRWQSELYCNPDDAAAISNLLTQGRAELERTELSA